MHRRSDRGAAAVEFALVAPFLILLVFGIIDFGAWFADQITVRQGAAAGARMAAAWSIDDSATPPWGTSATCGLWAAPDPSPEIRALGCAVLAGTQPLTGRVYIKISILPPEQLMSSSPAPDTAPNNWTTPNAVRVCLLQVHPSLTGFIPLPSDVLTARVDMPLQGTSTGHPALLGGEQTLPSGYSWPDSCP